MKKNIILIAAAVLALGMTACTDEPIITNGENPIENGMPMVKSTEDLIGTEWTYTMDDIAFVDMMGDTLTIPMDMFTLGLNFDANYAHFTFSDAIQAWTIADDGLTMEQITSIDFEYEYTYATHTGHLNGVGMDEEGNEVDAQLEFTYDDATDAITFILPLAYDMDGEVFEVPVVFHRN